MKQAVLFVGHGSPMIALENSPITQNLRTIGDYIIKKYGKPRAILSISAHWYMERNLIQRSKNPRQIYDMYGFPEELYQVKYPVEGSPDLADRVLDLVDDIEVNNDWGIDHGSWTVLVHLFPKADIPVAQLSVNRKLSPKEVFELGRSLQALRQEGVLILGSGNVVHNLRMADWSKSQGIEEADSFDAYIKNSIINKEYDKVIDYRQNRDSYIAVPFTDHFYPLIYSLGASGEDGVKVFNDTSIMGTLSMTSYLWK